MNRRSMLLASAATRVPPPGPVWSAPTPDQIAADVAFKARAVINGVPYTAIGPTPDRVLAVMAEVKGRVLAKDGVAYVTEESLVAVGGRHIIEPRRSGKTVSRERRLAGLRSDTIPRVICPA